MADLIVDGQRQNKLVTAPDGSKEWVKMSGYERQSFEVTLNYSKTGKPIPPYPVNNFSDGVNDLGEWPGFVGEMGLNEGPLCNFEGFETRSVVMLDFSENEAQTQFGIPLHNKTRNGFRQGCVNRFWFYVSSNAIIGDGSFEQDLNENNQWIHWTYTSDSLRNEITQISLRVGNGDQVWTPPNDQDEFTTATRSLDKGNTILAGEFDFSVNQNIAVLRASRNLRSVEIKNGFSVDFDIGDGVIKTFEMTRVTFEIAISGFAKTAFWSCEPYSLNEGQAPTTTVTAQGLEIFRNNRLMGAMICTLPAVQAGGVFEGAFTEGVDDALGLLSKKTDDLMAKDKLLDKDIADLKTKLAAGGMTEAEAKKIADEIKVLEAQQAATQKEIDDLEKQTRKHLFTRRAKIAPVPFLRNHGQTIKSTDGSILVDEGKVWAKTAADALYLPNMSFASTLAKGKAWVAVWADKSGNATLDMLGQPQGGNIGTDRPKLVDGAWTVYRKDFNVPSNNINTFFSWSLQAPVGDIQGPVFYELGKEDFTYGPYSYYGTFENEDGTTQQRELIDSERIAAIEASFNSLSIVRAIGGSTRFAGLPFIIAPDRMGARADVLAFTFGDNRRTTSGKMEYPARVTGVSLPISAVKSNTPPTDWTVATRTINGENLNAFKRTFNLKDTPTGANAFYDLWVSWKRNGTTYEFWFESLHSNSVTLGEVKDISVSYVKDDTAVDPGLKPLIDQVNDNAAKIKTNANNIARNSVNVAANATKITALEKTVAVKRPKSKAWAATLADLTVTMGQAALDTSGLLPPSADIDATVFTVVPTAPGVRAARVSFTIPDLVAGQEYELEAEVGSGLITNFAFEGGTETKVDGPSWNRRTITIKPTSTSYTGAYTVTHGATVHGPVLNFKAGLYVKDKNAVEYKVAEPGDVMAAQDAAFAGINTLNNTRITPLAARVTALEGTTGGKRANPAWFAAPRDYDTAYGRKVVDGKSAKTISFDFCAAGESATPMSMVLDTGGWKTSGDWGCPAKVINITPPGGTALTIAVAAYTDGYVAIGVGPSGASFTPVGKVRNVIIDGIIADTL